MKFYEGIGIAKGIGISPSVVIKKAQVVLDHNKIDDVSKAIEAFHEARLVAIQQVGALSVKVYEEIGEKEAEIFDAHIELLKDIELIEQVEDEIRNELHAPALAVATVGQRLADLFKQMDNEYFRERAADILDITGRIVGILLGETAGLSSITESCVLIAKDLSPSETSSIDTSLVKGIITEIGGKTSHSAIIARLLGIPYVVLHEATSLIETGQLVVVDGETGNVVVEPTDIELENYQGKMAELTALRKQYETLKGQEAKTKDGFRIQLKANIGSDHDIEKVLESDAEGVGLFRTEFIFMERSELPTEEEQFEIYKKVIQAMDNKPVTFRTLDIGGDKENPLFNLPREDNPFLGYRGIRLCLCEKEIFMTQLRALLRACYYGKGRIMFPMIADMEELLEAKEMLQGAATQLEAEGIDYGKNVDVGMMMETPSATLMADLFAKEVDFFSIGTNDLIQYTLAADRMNEHVAHLYSVYNPAVLRSILTIIQAGKSAGIEVSVCGEAAADSRLMPFWISSGIDILSMAATMIGETKWSMHLYQGEGLREMTDRWYQLASKTEVNQLLDLLIQK